MPDFRGHTDYLAEKAGLGAYGKDYLMAFLSPDLRVALLTVHQPLRKALDAITSEKSAKRCSASTATPAAIQKSRSPALIRTPEKTALLGEEDREVVAPGVAQAKAKGINASGPHPADSLFARAREGDFDWVLALTHDQGLIPVKTAAFGQATNWTLGLPYLRTSVDHGTALDIAGKGIANTDSLESVIGTTLRLLAERG